MFKAFPRLLLFALIILILGNFALGLLTNYASATTPEIFTRHPWLLWALIGGVLILLIVISSWRQFMESSESGKARNPKIPSGEPNYGGQGKLVPVDVFISYSHEDRAFVLSELIPFLNQHAFTYSVDFETFRAGTTSIEEIARHVEASKRVLLVLTENYINSDWSKFENILAQTMDPAARARKLIPVLVEECDIPLRIRMLHYRDLRSRDQVQWDRLARDLS